MIQAVQAHYAEQNPKVDTTDGLSLEFDDWRMNIRISNTEPLLRLNVEARNSMEQLAHQLQTIQKKIEWVC